MEKSANHFDRIPDDLLRLILNRVLDAKSLCACLAVSARFNSLAIHSTNLSLSVDRIHFDDENDSDDGSDSKHNLLRSLFRLFISEPLRFLTGLASSQTQVVDSSSSGAVFYSPTQALKSFSGIEVLKIHLPSLGELQLDSNPLLKWKARFGGEIKSCVIVAGTSVVDQIDLKISNSDEVEERRGSDLLGSRTCGIPEVEFDTAPFGISNDDLKTRVVWTISCLIAASSRHHLLKRIVSDHPMLKAIDMVDERGQGTLTMDESEITEMRNTTTFDESETRSRIPAVKMKMWHASELELPGCKKVMKGATLVVIGNCDVDGMFDDEEMFGEAAREIRRKVKQSYSLEMEAF